MKNATLTFYFTLFKNVNSVRNIELFPKALNSLL